VFQIIYIIEDHIMVHFVVGGVHLLSPQQDILFVIRDSVARNRDSLTN
jgi:hypothetical protein